MKPPRGRQQRILGLIDGYQSIFGGDAGSRRQNLSRVIAEMRKRPGHWFLVGQRSRAQGISVKVGATADDLKRHGSETSEVDGKLYARFPHKSGVLLESLLSRPSKRLQITPLPAVESDRFGWSRDELNNATATAKAWLFPIEGIAA